jgi:hypothetical protein
VDSEGLIAKRGQVPGRGGEESFKTLAANTEPPSIISESASNITEHDATLQAQIDPHDQTFITSSTPPPTGPSGQSGTSTVSGGSVSTPALTPLLSTLGNGSRRGETKVLTKTQQLAAALKACEKKPKKQRAQCKKQAETKYASPDKKSHKHRELLQRGG